MSLGNGGDDEGDWNSTYVLYPQCYFPSHSSRLSLSLLAVMGKVTLVGIYMEHIMSKLTCMTHDTLYYRQRRWRIFLKNSPLFFSTPFFIMSHSRNEGRKDCLFVAVLLPLREGKNLNFIIRDALIGPRWASHERFALQLYYSIVNKSIRNVLLLNDINFLNSLP